MEISLLLSNDSGSFQTILGQFISNESASAVASAAQSAESAAESAASATASANSAIDSQNSATASANSATAAGVSATNAGNSATASANSATAAGVSATNAGTSATSAGTSASSASASANTAAISVTSAQDAAALAQNWASQASGTVDGSNYSAKYYSLQAATSAASISLPIIVSSGGTGKTSHTANSILVGNGTSAVQNIGPGTNGQMLLGVTSGAPYWGNNPAIDGATIDNTVIGGSTPAAGTFSSLNSNGAMSVSYSSATLSVNDSSGSGQAKVLLRANNVSTWGLNSFSTSKQFRLDRYVSGSFTDSPVTVDNSTGAVSLSNALQVTGSATVTGVIDANSGVALPDGFFQMVTSSRRNRILNGCFRVVNRPTVSLGASGSLYGVDRWKFANGHTAGAFTIGTSAITPDATGVTVPSSRMLCTTATGTGTLAGYYGMLQSIEGYEAYDLRYQPVTVSFIWYSNWTGTAAVALRDGTNATSCVQTISVTAGAVKYYSVTFPAVPLSANVPYTSAAGLTLNIGCVGPTGTQATSLGVWQSGSLISHSSATPWGQTVNNEFRVAEVQLEAGTTATPFERRGVETEFAMCRRFWQNIPIIKVWGYAGAASIFVGGTTILQTAMRVIPTVNVSSGWAYQNCSGGTFETISNYELTYYAGSTAAGGLSYTASNVFLEADY